MLIKTVGVGKDYSTIQNAWDSMGTTWTDDVTIEVYSGTYGSVSHASTKNFNGYTAKIYAPIGESVTITRTLGDGHYYSFWSDAPIAGDVTLENIRRQSSL